MADVQVIETVVSTVPTIGQNVPPTTTGALPGTATPATAEVAHPYSNSFVLISPSSYATYFTIPPNDGNFHPFQVAESVIYVKHPGGMFILNNAKTFTYLQIAANINSNAVGTWGIGQFAVEDESEAYAYFDVLPGVPAPSALTLTQNNGIVTATWTAPATGTYDGYNVYRSSDGGNTYQRLNSALIPWGIDTYTDRTASNGETYSYYVATSLDGTESFPSNVVSIVLPVTGTTQMLISKTLRGFQLGLETTAGTIVAANKAIPNGTFSNKRNSAIKKVSAEGHKSAIGQQRGKMWSSWKIDGQIGYNVMPYWAAMLIGIAGTTPTTPGTGAYQYTYNMSSIEPDTPQTVTFEYGNSQGSNSRFGYGTMTDFSLHVNETTADYSASGVGAYPTKNITMTPTPTQVAPMLANMTDFRFNYADTFAGLSAGKLLTATDMQVDVKSKYKSKFFIDDATNSFGGILELRPDITGKIIVAEGTESDYFLNDTESSTLVYLQMLGTGPLIVTGTPNIYNLIQVTMAVYINNEDETDDSDLFAGSYDFYTGEDLTDHDFSIVCVNTLPTL